MTELWLKFRDENGTHRSVLVEGENFVIGRHQENDLCVPNAKLSRRHVKIERFASVYYISDCGTSNGTTLNGRELVETVALKNDDRLKLGGDLDIEVELVTDFGNAEKSNRAAGEADQSADYQQADNSALSGGTPVRGVSSGNSSIPGAVFLVAPLLVVMLLACGGGLLFFLGGQEEPSVAGNDGYNFSTPDETPEKTKPPPSPTAGNSSNGVTATPSPEETQSAPPETSSEAKKIEQNSSGFLRRIALNDPNAFLTAAQINLISSKISSLKGSSALADNFKAVKANSSQFETLAKSEGLTPQFLATAALAQLGGNRGNPLETAKTMLPVLSGLRISLANNLADDNLLIIAAFEQGKAGKFRDLRNVLEAQAKKNPSVSPREIRTIWFLKKQNKLTEAEYDFALRFLAVGTITQNPKDFNVNAEAVIF